MRTKLFTQNFNVPHKNIVDSIALAISTEAMAPSKSSYKTLPSGTLIRSHFHVAVMEGTIKEVLKKGNSAASTIYKIKPSAASHKEGEPEFVHRHGDKITVISKLSTKEELERLTHVNAKKSRN